MQLKGRLRRLLSTSTGAPPTERSRRTSDVSEASDISYDRSSGSFVQRVTTSLRTRTGRLRRTASESAVVEESFDGSFAYPDESSAQPSPFKASSLLPVVFHADKSETVAEPHHRHNPVSTGIYGDATGKPVNITADIEEEEEGEEEEEDKALREEEDDYPVPSAWGDEPSPEQLQQIQDRVSAWLDTSSRPSALLPIVGGGTGLRFPSTIETSVALLEVPEEDETTELLLAVRQPLRMLDSISEDEIPPTLVGSSVSTAPSTPFPLPASILPQIQIQIQSQSARSRSQSPPLRRRSLEGGQEDYYSRGGLDTIQEAGDVPPPPPPPLLASPRRSLDSGKKALLALESIPEIEPSLTTTTASTPSSTKRRLGIKGFGFTRSESEPLMSTIRSVPFNPTTTTTTTRSPSPNSNQTKRKAPTLNTTIFIGGKPVPTSGSGRSGLRDLKEGIMIPSPSLPSFQRGAKLVMGQQRSSAFTPPSGSVPLSELYMPMPPPPPPLLPPPLSLSLSEPRKPLNLKIHSSSSIAVETAKIEDEESRRLTELAFM